MFRSVQTRAITGVAAIGRAATAPRRGSIAPCHAITHRRRQARPRLGHLETVAVYDSDGTTALGIPNRDVISEWDIASRCRSGTVQNASARIRRPLTADRAQNGTSGVAPHGPVSLGGSPQPM